jgi:glycolate oxidase iron-sulfur subunit
MKGYAHWLKDPIVERFAANTRDVSELLADADLPLGHLDARVTYHDACHLAHGQGIRAEPRALLSRIPGVTLVPLADSDLCCGSAGVYNVLEPEMADQLLAMKVDRIIATGAQIVATGNPGCLLQITKGLRARGTAIGVVHPVELLARSVEAAAAIGSRG